jgi:hypothetical protein
MRKPSARYSWWDVVSRLLLASRTVLKCLSRAKSSKWCASAVASPRFRHALTTNIRESSHTSLRDAVNCAGCDNTISHLLDKEQAACVSANRSFINVVESVRQDKIIPDPRFVMGLKMLPPHLAYQSFRVLHMTGMQAPDDWGVGSRTQILTIHYDLGGK